MLDGQVARCTRAHRSPPCSSSFFFYCELLNTLQHMRNYLYNDILCSGCADEVQKWQPVRLQRPLEHSMADS